MIGTVTVGNKYHGEQGISVMRGMAFGNPFRLEDGYTREEAIAKYHVWLREKYRERTAVYQALIRLVERVEAGEHLCLICCCKPKACHADVIKDAIEKIVQSRIRV